MKLKKLFPIALAAASIVPCITSCGTFEKMEFENVKTETLLNREFVRTTEKATAQAFDDLNSAFKFYLENSKNNHKIYTDDVYLSAQEVLEYMLTQWSEEAMFTYSGFVGNMQFGIADVSPDTHRLSFGIKLDTTIVASLKELPSSQIKFNLKINLEADDIKFDLVQMKLEDESNLWWVHPAYMDNWAIPYEEMGRQKIDPWLLSHDHKWSFVYDGQINVLESVFPELRTDLQIEGSYNWKSVNDSFSLYMLESFYSILWHKVDYLSNTNLK